jgi:hypothetical protein
VFAARPGTSGGSIRRTASISPAVLAMSRNSVCKHYANGDHVRFQGSKGND